MMIRPEHTFRVGSLGFDGHERQMLRSLLAISECRTPTFKPFVRGEKNHPHIVIVNANSPTAVADWEKYSQHPKRGAHTVPVYLTRNPRRDAPVYELGRPIVATQLFALLEIVVTENHGFDSTGAAQPQDPMILLTPNEAASDGGRGPAPTRNQTSAEVAATGPAAVVRDIKALVIDHSLPVQMQMLAALHPIAAHIDFADSGGRAFEYLETNAYSVVFLDVVLPDVDSYEVCHRIKRHPLHRNTPVVMLVGRSTPADRAKGSAAGCNAYLIKPVRPATFQQLVGQFMRVPGAV